MHAGLYKYNRYEYTNDPAVNRTTPLDGTYYLLAKGHRRQADRHQRRRRRSGDLRRRRQLCAVRRPRRRLHLLRGADVPEHRLPRFSAGTQFLAGAKGLTVKHCRFEDVGAGIFTNYSGSSNFYIADNYFIGRHDPDHVIGWSGDFWSKFNGKDGQKFPPVMGSYIAVKVYGPGHVIAYNYVANFHDGIDMETYGNPDGSAAVGGAEVSDAASTSTSAPVSIDFYNNYMTNFHDNPFEVDGSMHNVRVMRNMMINSASHAFCNQPAIGGPVYWVRNIVYHMPGGSTRLTGGSAGAIFYNNTVLSETQAQGASNVHWANNLFLGENSAPAIFSINTYTNYTSSDYNGFRPNPGAPYSFAWNSPPCDGRRLQPAAARGPRRRGRRARRASLARDAAVQDARRIQPGDASGSAQRARRLRHLHERAEARRAGRGDGPEGVQGGVVRFPAEARIGGC